MKHTYIIAEAGVNHNGNREMAFQLVDAAVEAGVDAVKFQTFKAENVVTRNADKAAYQKKTTTSPETHFEMLKRLELSYDLHHELVEYCHKNKIEFLSTAFDLESLDFLSNKLKLNKLKIPSGEITNGPLLLAHAKTGCDLILSTGMAMLGEIEEALSVLAFGLTQCQQEPSRRAFKEAYVSEAGRKVLQEKVTLLHCTTDYPTSMEDVNLKAMVSMAKKFSLPVGYSDHSEGIIIPIAATALEARVIEKHFTLDKSLSGPDHLASLNPSELSAMVQAVRRIEDALGDGKKQPQSSELANRYIVRKSLVAATEIVKGDVFSKSNIEIKRPGIGISPMNYWDLIGTVSNMNIMIDKVINEKCKK